MMMPDDMDADRGGQMGFAGIGSIDEDDVMCIVDEFARMERVDQDLINGTLGTVETG